MASGMVFNATFNNISVISWRSVLLVEEIGITEKEKTVTYTCFRFTDIDKTITNHINSKNKLKTVHLHQINNELY